MVTDVLLDAALSAAADFVGIEPSSCAEDRYLISIEREGQVVATATLEVTLASAVISRLACLARVDLTTTRTTTGAVTIRSGECEREMVFTLRPGAEPRAEAMFVRRGPRATIPNPAPDQGRARSSGRANEHPSSDELWIGDTVDHYRVIGKLGSGGMGSVYQVEQTSLGRHYALKVLHRDVLARDATSVERFLREARAASRIRHRHIVDVFDFGYLPDGRPYLVMELLEGRSLLRILDAGALFVERAVALARQLGEALAAAHECGVVHADVSTANVLVENDDIKLVDFGLSELRGPTMPVRPSDVFFGTPIYVAPELVRGLPADALSDQYSFGVVLFEMVVGKPPFADRNIRELCIKHLRDPVPDPISPYGPLPDALVNVIARCLAKSPAVRYPTMRAMLAELAAAARLVGSDRSRKCLAS